ncbi:MAG: Hpt domain-containing protein [Gammaproteobacteria bacterium]
MHEAIDYNALGWVRKELGETLNQARLQLEEYALDPANEGLLQRCATLLHEALGPLQMVNVRGAVLLASEMEGVLADLHQGTIEESETALELLMRSFLQLPDYLSSIRSGREEKPEALLHLVNSLRATRGEQPLQQSDIFSPNLRVRVPVSVFDVRAEPLCQDVPSMARAARVRFQSGLLEWYRNTEGNGGLETLVEVLEHLQQCAGSEPVARIWWAGAGVAEALRDGLLETTVETKQLFGQLDRQIKRLIDAGEAVFDDVLSDDLMKNLLFRLAQAAAGSERIMLIRETYGIKQLSVDPGLTGYESDTQIACSDELMQTVAVTMRCDIERIKESLDDYKNRDKHDSQILTPVANDLHALANTLGMIGLVKPSEAVALQEHAIREMISGDILPDDSALDALANTLVFVEDALVDDAGDKAEGAAFKQGLDAVTREVVASMGMAKEAISEYLRSSDDFDSLSVVPELLNQISGGMRLANQDRVAVAVDQVKQFIAHELIERHQSLHEDQLDSLADAICSIEFYIEEISENRSQTGTALDVAEESMAKLGYPRPRVDESAQPPGVEDGRRRPAGESEFTEQLPQQAIDVEETAEITALQVIAPDVDEEILEIFIEEADEELQKLAAFIPIWSATTEAREYLVDVRRSFHTLKGSGRMVGALAVGEFAWALENLVNTIIDETVVPNDVIKSILSDSVGGLAQLLAEIKGEAVDHVVDVNSLARKAIIYSDPSAIVEDEGAEECSEQSTEYTQESRADELVLVPDNEIIESAVCEQPSSMDLPVLSPDADAEIVEIFLEEAAEEITVVAAVIPEWLSQSGSEDALATLRRSFHTLKGSGRMAGAMLIGEFSWCMENLLSRVIEGSIEITGSMHSLLGNVPDALSQLVNQIQGGPVPTINVASMMQQADALSRGVMHVPETGGSVVDEREVIEEPVDPDGEQHAESSTEYAMQEEASLLEIFGTECNDHLQAIKEFLEPGDEPRLVTEALYRALHTLSGISESADVISIRDLAGDLNDYIDEYYQSNQLIGKDAINVLRSAVTDITGAVEHLPDVSFDASIQKSLCDRIAALPRVEGQPEEDDVVSSIPDPVEPHVDTVELVDTPIAGESDPFSDMDQELYEIFVEEASEIIDSSEVVLRAWVKQPENIEHMTEFQRQLHTIKGGARMMDIQSIGDLSHVLESLMTRIADGVIATSDELFALMQESHDRLSEMLEQVKSRQMPAVAEQLQVRLDAFWQTGCDSVVSDEAAGVSESNDETGNDSASDAVEIAVEEGTCLEDADCVDEAASVENDVSVLPDAENDVARCENEISPEANTHPELPGRTDMAFPQKVEPKKQVKEHGEQVRIQSNLLDDMVNYAGEINIYRSRMEQQVTDYRFNLAELEQTITRLRNQLRQLEMETEAQVLYRYEQEADIINPGFDPLEMDRYSNLQQLSRSLVESISDLRSLQELMENTTRESETLLLQQSRVSTDLQEGLMRTRMIPFSGLSSRLRRIVRQSARQLEKKVELELVGADGEMDRTVIDRVIAPLEHMLRNAVAHGIELPEQRIAAGKQATGLIAITFDREGPEIVLRIEDDGAGVNTEAIRTRAIERGLMPEDSMLSDNDVMQFILQTGFSTAKEVTQISGRGVGLDVVNSEVKQLGGSLHIESTAGLGTSFTVRLPYTLAINQALLVMAGKEPFCVPLGSVEGVVRANCEELADLYRSDECLYGYAGNEYQLKHLGTLLNTSAVDLGEAQGQVPVLLVRIGEKRIALQVEALMGSREIVIKPVGAQLSTVDCISGATILGDGSVVMMLDMAAVARMNARARLPEIPVIAEQESRLVIMVVDDSITVRKVTSRLLERNGYKVLTAKDGVDAMGQLQEVVPDMMLLDIEMPRMDGFELATHMRNDERLKHMPIIMITSRTGDKHRERAQQIGVNNYLGKPYQENDLLNAIQHIIGVSEAEDVA